MLGLFREADLEKRLETVERIIRSQVELDQHGKNLVERQLDSRSNEVDPSELQEALQKTSDDAKDEIIELVKDARAGDDATDATRTRAIPVLRTLIDLDTNRVEHRYHGQLGYILLDLGELTEAEEELTEAMNIRDRRGKSGWKYYEYKRAIAKIRKEVGKASQSTEVRDQIISDIRNALGDPKRRDSVSRDREITSWLEKNGLKLSDLGGSASADG
jgi:tetratricopeptide (TPR) repeat protein